MTPVKRILRGGVEMTVKEPNVVIDYIKHGWRGRSVCLNVLFLKKIAKMAV